MTRKPNYILWYAETSPWVGGEIMFLYRTIGTQLTTWFKYSVDLLDLYLQWNLYMSLHLLLCPSFICYWSITLKETVRHWCLYLILWKKNIGKNWSAWVTFGHVPVEGVCVYVLDYK